MKFTIGQFATVTSSIDETCAAEWIGKTVTIESLNTNGETGNTEENPLYVCKDENGQTESFWSEELTPATFYTFFNQDGPYHSGHNTTSLEQAKNQFIDLFHHDTEEEDREQMESFEPEQFFINFGLRYETQNAPFPESVFE